MRRRKVLFYLFLILILYVNSPLPGDCTLKLLPSEDEIEGISIHVNQKFIEYKVHAKGIYLDVQFDSDDSLRTVVETYKELPYIYCNLKKENEREVIQDNILKTNNCVIFLSIRYKKHLKQITSVMDYLHKNTSAVGLILLCDDFLYENEIYNPHEELNFTIIKPSILTYMISNELFQSYSITKLEQYTLELFWGVNHKTEVVHLSYHLDFGKYFNYSFFIYMKHFLLHLKNRITYDIQFSIHNNFTIEPRFCFIRDSSYCISKPDYVNTNMIREVVEQQVRSLCVFEKTLEDEDEKIDQTYPYFFPKNEERSYLNNYATYEKVSKDLSTPSSDTNEGTESEDQNFFTNTDLKKKRQFSQKFIHYINALFHVAIDKGESVSEVKESQKKYSDEILKSLNVSIKEVHNCFIENFHDYMKNMIKTKFYIYSIEINGKTYKIKLNKDIATKLICSAFKNMPPYCSDYLKYASEVFESRKYSKIHPRAFWFFLICLLIHIVGSLFNYIISYFLDKHLENKGNKELNLQENIKEINTESL